MRIALISDIHGNLVALDAVLADIARKGVDQVVCLGDVATLSPQPREILARLKALDCLCQQAPAFQMTYATFEQVARQMQTILRELIGTEEVKFL